MQTLNVRNRILTFGSTCITFAEVILWPGRDVNEVSGRWRISSTRMLWLIVIVSFLLTNMGVTDRGTDHVTGFYLIFMSGIALGDRVWDSLRAVVLANPVLDVRNFISSQAMRFHFMLKTPEAKRETSSAFPLKGKLGSRLGFWSSALRE